MNTPSCPDYIKLEIRSIPPVSWTLEFKRDGSGGCDVLAFHHWPGMSASEAHRGKATEEAVSALHSALQAIHANPQSGNRRVIADGNLIEVRIPAGRFQFLTCEEGENGGEFQRCLWAACSGALDTATWQRWKLDSI